MAGTEHKPTIVLVHGAWADGSSWARVITRLRNRGHKVIAAPIPLTSLSDDVAALERVLAHVGGPVILGGHAYAGAVIGAVASDQVKALVFVAALAPDEGETVAEVFYRHEPHALAPKLAPDEYGLIWMPDEGFASAFAPEATPDQIALFAAVQRPIALACIQEAAPAPRWKTIPSFYLVAERDRMIDQSTQHYLAERMHATIRVVAADHMPLHTAPDAVVDLFETAAGA